MSAPIPPISSPPPALPYPALPLPSAASPPRPTAFIHVDLDELWAIGECYGLRFSRDTRPVYETGLPRLRAAIESIGVRATWFAVGHDAAHPSGAAALASLAQAGHAIANHSLSHRLDFRTLSPDNLAQEIDEAHHAIAAAVGHAPVGFRAPGYGTSPALHAALAQRGYLYDSSVAPSPFGGVFRFLDARLRSAASQYLEFDPAAPTGSKTQYSHLADLLAHPLRPHPVPLNAPPGHPTLLEYPCAVAPGLRLPFQAGVCLRLGMRYFEYQLARWRRHPSVPLVFLAHGADLADFAPLGHGFFSGSSFFSEPVDRRDTLFRAFLTRLAQERDIVVTEKILTSPQARKTIEGAAKPLSGPVR